MNPRERPMVIKIAPTLCLGFVCLMAALLVEASGGAPRSPAKEEMVVFLVDDQNGRSLEGAIALLLTTEGEQIVGNTDALGSVEIPLKQLASEEVFAVLLCKEGFYCGAIRKTKPRFLEYREHYIRLAPGALR